MQKTGRTLTISAAVLAGLLVPVVASEARAGWAHQRKITIDTTASGATVPGDVKSFPVPVRLDAANFDFGQAKAGGADIRFDDASGRPLPYEIEKWDAAAKQAAIWVRTDVKGNATQTMTLKWGNPEASSESDGTKVFAKADGWITAHHLAEKGAANGYRDSAGNLDGKGVNITGDATGAGVVGNALSLNRARSEYVLLPGSETSGLFTPLPSRGTFSIWSNAKTHPAAYIAMFSKGESGFRIHYFGEGDQTEPCVDVANYDWCPLPSGAYTKVKNNTWYHFVFVIDKPNAYYYINGKLEVGKTDTNAWKTTGTEPVTIGNNEKTAGGNSRKRSFDGLLDEARVLSVPKDRNWAKLDFESQKPGSKLLRHQK